MLYSNTCSVFGYSFVKDTVPGSVTQLVTSTGGDDRVDSHILDILTKYDDHVSIVSKSLKHLVYEKRIIVAIKESHVWPSYFFLPRNSNGQFSVLINLDQGGLSNIHVRETIGTILLLYPYLYKMYKRPNKDVSLIPFASNLMSRMLYTSNKRPVQEEVFFVRSLIFLTGHYLWLYHGNKPSHEDLKTFVAKVKLLTREVAMEIDNYYKIVENFEKTEHSLYNGKTFLRLFSEHVLSSVYDVVVSQTIAKFGPDLCAALDEPSYLTPLVVGGKLFKTNTIYSYVSSDVLNRFFNYVRAHTSNFRL